MMLNRMPKIIATMDHAVACFYQLLMMRTDIIIILSI